MTATRSQFRSGIASQTRAVAAARNEKIDSRGNFVTFTQDFQQTRQSSHGSTAPERASSPASQRPVGHLT